MEKLVPSIVKELRDEILSRVKELLEQKHLYQSVRVDISGAKGIIDNIEKSGAVKRAKDIAHAGIVVGNRGGGTSPDVIVNQFIQQRRQEMFSTINVVLRAFWTFRTDACTQHKLAIGANKSDDVTEFVLPTIRVNCTQCDAVSPPHNSGFRGQTYEFPSISFSLKRNDQQTPYQTFLFPYQCQSCKKEALVFLVHRDGVKLTLAGRNHFESIVVPKTIPKPEREHYSDAVVAYNTGNILAGLFLLRTTIEQYMRRILSIIGKVSGDDLADQYSKLLDDEFPRRYPSLKVVYEEVSAKLHLAEKDTEQFEKSLKNIDRHFELLKHLPLKT